MQKWLVLTASLRRHEAFTIVVYRACFGTTTCIFISYAFRALTLLVGQQEGHPACKKIGWWMWALVSPDGVAPSRMVGVSASVKSSLAP